MVAEHDRSNRIAGVPVFAVDVNPDQTWASIAVAGKRADGLHQCAVVAHERGTGWLIDMCVRLKKAHHGAKFVVDKDGPAAEKISELKAARVRVIEATSEDYKRASGGLVSAVNERRLRYPYPQPELDEALAGARKNAPGDAWKWSRKNSTSADISPLVACTLAHWASETGKPRARVINPNELVRT